MPTRIDANTMPRTLSAFYLSALLALPAMAQTSAASSSPSSPDAPQDETVQLNAFHVSEQGDNGYFAKNTLLGTRSNERLTNIPQNIQIVNRELLQDLNFDNGIDALKYAISGASKRDSASTDVFIRGQRIGNASFLRNGVKFRGSTVNPPTYDVDRIEVIKGPAALLFGLDASAGGVINYVTSPATDKSTAYVKGTVGSFDLLRGEVGVSGPIGSTGLSYRVTGEATESDGRRRFDKFDDKFLGLAVDYRLSKTTTASLYYSYYYVDTIKSPGRALSNGRLPVGVSDDFSPQESWATAPHYLNYLSAMITTQLAENFEMRYFANFSDHDFDLHQVFASVADATTGNMTRTYQNYQGAERAYNMQLDFVKKFTTGSVAHKVTFGTSGKYQRLLQTVDQLAMSAQNIYNPVYGAAMPVLPGRGVVAGATATNQKSYEANLYIQEQASFFQERLILLGGLGSVAENNRVKNLLNNTITRDRSSHGSLNRYAILGKPVTWLSTYYAHSESISFPNTIFPSGPRQGQFLDPSYTESDDFGVKVETPDGRWFGGISYFDMDTTNLSRQIVNPDGTQALVQAGRQTNKGWELDLGFTERLPIGPLQVILTGYNADTKGDDRLLPPGVTNNLYSALVSQSFTDTALKGLKVGAGFFHKGWFYLGNFSAPGHDEITAFVSYRWKGFGAALNVDNLSDKRYVEAGTGTSDLSISPGRTFKFSLEYRF